MSLNTRIEVLNVEELRFFKGWCSRQLILNAHRHEYASKLMRKLAQVEQRETELNKETKDVQTLQGSGYDGREVNRDR
jgi:hypothetical protein